jgi:hypothetical protein
MNIFLFQPILILSAERRPTRRGDRSDDELVIINHLTRTALQTLGIGTFTVSNLWLVLFGYFLFKDFVKSGDMRGRRKDRSVFADFDKPDIT